MSCPYLVWYNIVTWLVDVVVELEEVIPHVGEAIVQITHTLREYNAGLMKYARQACVHVYLVYGIIHTWLRVEQVIIVHRICSLLEKVVSSPLIFKFFWRATRATDNVGIH